MDMVIFDCNHRKWGDYYHFAVVKGNKLYVSRYREYADEIKQLADKNIMPFIWQRFSDYSNLAPSCVRNQEPRYRDSIPGFEEKYFYEFDLNAVPYHWRWAAEKYIEENSQDVHSKEYLNWIADRSVFYNNGFYDYAVRNNCAMTTIEVVKACMGKTYEELYTVHEHRSDEYGFMDAYTTAVRLGDKYIIYGTGGEVCSSDWMNFRVFWVYTSETEMMETLQSEGFSYKKIEKPSKVSRFFEFIKTHNMEDELIEKLA